MNKIFFGTEAKPPISGYRSIPIPLSDLNMGTDDVEIPQDQSNEPLDVETDPESKDVEDENPDDFAIRKYQALVAGIAAKKKSGRVNVILSWGSSPEQGVREIIRRKNFE